MPGLPMISNMQQQALIPHLFRTEYRKIVSVLCKRFGIDKIDIAEDITSETFATAAETWPLKGIPPYPIAWLYLVARNKTQNYLKRNILFANKIVPELRESTGISEETVLDLSDQHINDSQLQMMFAICHPCLSAESQIALSLRILCAFGIEEIASAFLTHRETINKRLMRAKQKLRDEKINIEWPDNTKINQRLQSVLNTIYLLFNEGYYSIHHNDTIRKDLCLEAMRLCNMLVENTFTSRPEVNALLSLMCFQASRLDARLDERGELILYYDQDPTLWNNDLIHQGIYFLNRSATGKSASRYHLEAGIAYWNTQHNDSEKKWQTMLQLYDQLLTVAYSPIAALNRAYIFSKIHGKAAAIHQAEKLNLTNNQFYFSLMGELYTDIENEKAKQHITTALLLAKTNADKKILQKKLDKLNQEF